MYRATLPNLAVSGESFGASLDVVPLSSTEVSSAVHNPYLVGGWFGRKKIVYAKFHNHDDNTSRHDTSTMAMAKHRLDTDPQLTQDIRKLRLQNDGWSYGVYLNTSNQKFQVGVVMHVIKGTVWGFWVKTYNGGNLTRDMALRAWAAYQRNSTAHEWSAPGTTFLDHWYWYQNDIADLGSNR